MVDRNDVLPPFHALTVRRCVPAGRLKDVSSSGAFT
jgi:hypothetical protein